MASRFDHYKNKAEMAEGEFLFRHRELFAHFDSSDMKASLIAFLKLNYAKDLNAAANNPTQLTQMLSKAFLTLFDRGTLSLLSELNEDAQEDLVELRKATGIGIESLPVPPPPAPTAAELLREDILNDWRTLPMSKVREKRNGNRQYAAMLDELANDGFLESSATSLTRAS